MSSGPGAGDQAEVAQEAQLVGDRRLLHPDRVGQAGHAEQRRLAQSGQDQQPAGVARACRVTATFAAASASSRAAGGRRFSSAA